MTKITVNISIKKNKIIKQFDDEEQLLSFLYDNLGTIDDKIIINRISSLHTLVPMYDIYTENIILIKSIYVEQKIKQYYRPIDDSIIKLINKTKKNKMINFLKNFDTQLLYSTFLKNYKNAVKFLDEYTTCIKPSFLPLLDTTTPYYTKKELKYIALNNNKWNEKMREEELCDIIKENDISYEDLLYHHDYIKNNNFNGFIKIYTFFNGELINKYLRYPRVHNRDEFNEKYIENFRNFLIKSPAWKKSYYLYRWIKTDDFLNNLKIGDNFIEKGFTSTTRNPFIEKDRNYFGFILLKIKVPANKTGCGLAIEFYSSFKSELEIIFPPGKFKIINKSDTKYYHIDESIEKSVINKYELEWIGYTDNYIEVANYKLKLPIKKLDLNETIFNIESRFIFRYDTKLFYKKYGNRFRTNIGNEPVDFVVNKIQLDENLYKMQYHPKSLLTKKREGIYLIWYDQNYEINLIIEIDFYVNVNYYFRYVGGKTKIIGDYTYDDVIIFLKKIANIFWIDKINIYSDYGTYYDLINTSDFENDITSYHSKQLYIADTFYYNQLLYSAIYFNKKNIKLGSKFIEYLNKTSKCIYSKPSLEYIMNISINDFIEIISNIKNNQINEKEHDYDSDSAVNVVIKIAQDIEKSLRPSRVASVSDLYIKLFTDYYYYVNTLNKLINQSLKINFDIVYYQINAE